MPFGGREAVLADLDRWADDDARVSVRLCTARAVARRGSPSPGSGRGAPAPATRRRLRRGPLDADALDTRCWRRRGWTWVTDAASRPRPAGPAGPPGGRTRHPPSASGCCCWPAAWATGGPSWRRTPPSARCSLTVHPPSSWPSWRRAPSAPREFRRAAEAFRVRRGWPATPSAPKTCARFGRPLYLHMAALLAGRARPVADALPRLLDHEARSWLARVGLRGAETMDAAVELRRASTPCWRR
ncbi:MAG: hypothetical protein R3F60_24255 [bacterium]